MFRIICAALLVATVSSVVKADDLPDDTKVRAMSIHPSNRITIPAGIATLKECRKAVAEMMDQLKAEDDERSDGTIYACIPVDLASNELMLLDAARFERSMFKQ